MRSVGIVAVLFGIVQFRFKFVADRNVHPPLNLSLEVTPLLIPPYSVGGMGLQPKLLTYRLARREQQSADEK